ncbi:AraC family transcriptional regulator [Actinoplanes sp. N902-109]|uniref:AraC family transcriptional regulator n=1 Tax=Actinoplanes sp. (strain N902-109) TaxID=649831 RepID=UPI0012FBB675|nr:AraC family transcriptional regulator [Actinoplanes sp. N902-109]
MITAVTDSVRVTRAHGRRITESGEWGMSFTPIAVLGVHVLLRGSGWLVTADRPPVEVRPGDVVLVAAGAEHGLASSPVPLAGLPPFELAHVPEPPGAADFEFLCGAYPMVNGRVPQLVRQLPPVLAVTPDYERDPELRVVIDMLRTDLAEPGAGTETVRAALIDLLLVHVLRCVRPEEWPATTAPGVASALREIHDQPHRAWTVDRLSAVAGMSRTTFTRQFTAAVGMPPMSYLLDWRLTAAARLLQRSPAPLAAVARQVGYATEYGFATAFRRKYGISPGRFRTGGALPGENRADRRRRLGP